MTNTEADSKLEEWKKIIEAARSSGKPIQEWCEDNGVSARNYYYWNKKIKEAESSSQFYEVSEEQSVEKLSSDLILQYKQFSLVIPNDVDTAVLEKVVMVLTHA